MCHSLSDRIYLTKEEFYFFFHTGQTEIKDSILISFSMGRSCNFKFLRLFSLNTFSLTMENTRHFSPALPITNAWFSLQHSSCGQSSRPGIYTIKTWVKMQKNNWSSPLCIRALQDGTIVPT